MSEYLNIPDDDGNKHNTSILSNSDMADTPAKPRESKLRNKYLSREISDEDEQDQEEDEVPMKNIQLPS